MPAFDSPEQAKLKIDPEFRKLIPPLATEELDELEESILKHGIRDSLVTWKGVVVDGMHRLSIATKHELKFSTKEIEFDSRGDAMIWMIKNQFSRRNITKFTRGVLALRLEAEIAEKAKERKVEGARRGGESSRRGSATDAPRSTAGVQNRGRKPNTVSPSARGTETNKVAPTLAQPYSGGASASTGKKERSDTRKELAKIAGISTGSIAKTKVVAAKADEETQAKLRSGEVSLNKAYNEIKEKEAKSKPMGEDEAMDFVK